MSRSVAFGEVICHPLHDSTDVRHSIMQEVGFPFAFLASMERFCGIIGNMGRQMSIFDILDASECDDEHLLCPFDATVHDGMPGFEPCPRKRT